jgi:aspartate aminotransferase-like enzyme
VFNRSQLAVSGALGDIERVGHLGQGCRFRLQTVLDDVERALQRRDRIAFETVCHAPMEYDSYTTPNP